MANNITHCNANVYNVQCTFTCIHNFWRRRRQANMLAKGDKCFWESTMAGMLTVRNRRQNWQCTSPTNQFMPYLLGRFGALVCAQVMKLWCIPHEKCARGFFLLWKTTFSQQLLLDFLAVGKDVKRLSFVILLVSFICFSDCFVLYHSEYARRFYAN